MSTTEEATVNPDGTTTFGDQASPPVGEPMGGEDTTTDDVGGDETMENIIKEIDPTIYLGLALLLIFAIYLFFWWRSKQDQQDDFFSGLDGDKFNIKLPAAVDEYYEVKEKCEEAGWTPGKGPGPGGPQANGPHRLMAQALMKRCIADIPIVQHIQKESAGMNKLYSQSMCSVRQWRAFQAAESLVSTEVDEVRAEADEIEPGWSQVIWRQAMQYHQMLKEKHEQEAKQAAEVAAKRKEIEARVAVARAEQQRKEDEDKKKNDKKAQEAAAEKAAAELLKLEEREKDSKKAFGASGSGMKKGFLNSSKKK